MLCRITAAGRSAIRATSRRSGFAVPRASTARAIALATIRPCPEIAPARVAVRLSDGFEFSPYGSTPWPCRVETRGVVFYDKRSNTYYGKRYADAQTARHSHHVNQLRNAAQFLHELRGMTPGQIADQAAYWLKGTV